MVMNLREKRDLLDDAILALERFSVAGTPRGRRAKRLEAAKATAIEGATFAGDKGSAEAT
jgi:hypothetical protein